LLNVKFSPQRFTQPQFLAQEEFKLRAQSPEGPKEIDRNQKNINLLQKLDVLTGAMNQIPSKRKVKTRVIHSHNSFCLIS